MFSLQFISKTANRKFPHAFSIYIEIANVFLRFRVSLLLIQLEIDFLLRKIVLFQFPLVLAFELFSIEPRFSFIQKIHLNWIRSRTKPTILLAQTINHCVTSQSIVIRFHKNRLISIKSSFQTVFA